MIPIGELPEVTQETTLLETAQLLLESGAPAVRYENANGKIVVATVRDLGLPR